MSSSEHDIIINDSDSGIIVFDEKEIDSEGETIILSDHTDNESIDEDVKTVNRNNNSPNESEDDDLLIIDINENEAG